MNHQRHHPLLYGALLSLLTVTSCDKLKFWEKKEELHPAKTIEEKVEKKEKALGDEEYYFLAKLRQKRIDMETHAAQLTSQEKALALREEALKKKEKLAAGPAQKSNIDTLTELIGAMKNEAAVNALGAMSPEKAAQVIARFDKDKAAKLLAVMPKEQMLKILKVIGAPEGPLAHKSEKKEKSARLDSPAQPAAH